MKFKVGDKVRIVKNIWADGVTRPSIGINEVHTIKGYSNNSRNPYMLDGYFGYCWNDDELELVTANQKIVITTDGKITTAKLYENGKVVKTAEAKCCTEDTFDFNVGAKLAVERLTKVEEIPKYYNGKVVCIDNGGIPDHFTIGKIYTLVDGVGESDIGVPITARPVNDVDDLNKRFISGVKFIEVVE